MKERGILFAAESMRANLAGRKTMTRRVIKPQPPQWATRVEYTRIDAYDLPPWVFLGDDGQHAGFYRCPYGQVGGRLWAKETWTMHENDKGADCLLFKADVPDPELYGPWRSPIFMPRWASRFVAEIVTVRVERVQDISEADAMAEGINLEDGECKCGEPMRGHRYDGDYHTPVPMFSARELYRGRWDVINAKRGHGWDVNDWVWCITYQEEQP